MSRAVKLAAIVGVALLAIAALGAWRFFGPPATVSDRAVSGVLIGHHRFAGVVTVTGDITVLGHLIVDPGTTVRFVASDDVGWGDEVPADGYNDADPTRLEAYTKTHAALIVLGRMTAVGTATDPIVFTSAEPTPKLADWEAFYFFGNGSAFDSITVEYSRQGMNPLGHQPDSVARNSVFRHNLWSGPSLSSSSMRLYDSDISDAGHEGVDVQGGRAVIKGNRIHDIHAGIVVVAGSAVVEDNVLWNVGDGFGPPGAVIEAKNNDVRLADPDDPAVAAMEWRYGDFAYHMFGPATVGDKR